MVSHGRLQKFNDHSYGYPRHDVSKLKFMDKPAKPSLPKQTRDDGNLIKTIND